MEKRRRLGSILTGIAVALCSFGVGAEERAVAEFAALAQTDERAVAEFAALAQPLVRADDLSPLLERIGARPYILLGEATHGTSEFYQWRSAISRRLISEKGFRFIAVEGDWEACYRLNRYVKHLPDSGESARSILESFERWPRWMWANEDINGLIEWLRGYNENRSPEARVGFYGIDLYGPGASLAQVLGYFREEDPVGAALAQEVAECLGPYWGSLQSYGYAAQAGQADCSGAVARLSRHLAGQEADRTGPRRKAWFNAKRNAAVLKGAEAHYRAMGEPDRSSWNMRVAHFLGTVEALMDYKGEGARGIIWAHNTHVGDARATAMSARGSTNIGQLLRERHGEEKVFAVGFGTHRGTVIAGRAWEAPMERMDVPPGAVGSTEALLHQVSQRLKSEQFLLLFDAEHRKGPINELRGHRAIGVVYNPEAERGNYVPTRLSMRYDAFIFIERTTALTPLHP